MRESRKQLFNEGITTVTNLMEEATKINPEIKVVDFLTTLKKILLKIKL